MPAAPRARPAERLPSACLAQSPWRRSPLHSPKFPTLSLAPKLGSRPQFVRHATVNTGCLGRALVVVVARVLTLGRGARGAPLLILAPAPPSSPDASAPAWPHALCPTACYPPLVRNDMPRYHSRVGPCLAICRKMHLCFLRKQYVPKCIDNRNYSLLRK